MFHNGLNNSTDTETDFHIIRQMQSWIKCHHNKKKYIYIHAWNFLKGEIIVILN